MSVDFDPWSTDDQQTGKAAPATTGKPPSASAATLLVHLALKSYRLGISEGGEPFAVPLDGDPRHIARLLRGGQGSLRAELADVFFDRHHKAAPQTALTDALVVLEGKASKATPEKLALRVAEGHEALWLDLGRPDGLVVKITAERWALTNDCPILFYRTALTGALPEPQDGGSLDDLWSLLNVAENFRPLIVACQVASLFPNIPHPIMSLHGEQGTGKTTAAKRLAGTLDPSPAQVRKAPRDVESWVTAASGSWFVALDNLSHIPDWLSDALCRASTGDADVRRTLYTDGGLTVFAFRRVVILNGIDLGSLNGDLVDRLVAIHLDVIPEDRRQREDVLEAAWLGAHPRILGALLDVASRVMAERPKVELEGYPRMADFAHILATVDRVMDTHGYATYIGLRDDLAQEAIEADSALAAIVEHVTDEFLGTAHELLVKIAPLDEKAKLPRDWPKNPRALTIVLTRNSPTLRRLGWTVEKTGRKHYRTRAELWRIEPPLGASEGASEQASEESHSPSHSPLGTPSDLHEREKIPKGERNERDLRTYSVDKVRGVEGEGTARDGSYFSLASLAPLANDRQSVDLFDIGHVPEVPGEEPRHGCAGDVCEVVGCQWSTRNGAAS